MPLKYVLPKYDQVFNFIYARFGRILIFVDCWCRFCEEDERGWVGIELCSQNMIIPWVQKSFKLPSLRCRDKFFNLDSTRGGAPKLPKFRRVSKIEGIIRKKCDNKRWFEHCTAYWVLGMALKISKKYAYRYFLCQGRSPRNFEKYLKFISKERIWQ